MADDREESVEAWTLRIVALAKDWRWDPGAEEEAMRAILSRVGPPPIDRDLLRAVSQQAEQLMRVAMMNEGEVEYDEAGFAFWQGAHVEIDHEAAIDAAFATMRVTT